MHVPGFSPAQTYYYQPTPPMIPNLQITALNTVVINTNIPHPPNYFSPRNPSLQTTDSRV